MKYALAFCLLLVLGSPALGREDCTPHEKFVEMLGERGETVTMTTQVLFAVQIPTVTKMIYDLRLDVDTTMDDWKVVVTDKRYYVNIGYKDCSVYSVPVAESVAKKILGNPA